MKSNTAEGGSDGTLVTAANSGGASGDAFTSRVAVANSVIKFSTAALVHGLLGYEFLNSSGAPEANYVVWDDTAIADYWGRMYLKFAGTPTDTVELRQFRASSAGVIGCHLSTNTSRQLQIRTSAEGLVSSMTTVPAIGTLYRLEYHIICTGASTVDVTLNLYQGESAVTTDTLTALGVTSSGAIASIGSVRVGAATSTANTQSIYMDDLVEFSPTPPGSSLASPPPPPVTMAPMIPA